MNAGGKPVCKPKTQQWNEQRHIAFFLYIFLFCSLKSFFFFLRLEHKKQLKLHSTTISFKEVYIEQCHLEETVSTFNDTISLKNSC